MKKLMLICSVTFMFLLLGYSASAQNGPKAQAIQKIKTYLQELPTTTTASVSQVTLEDGQVGQSSTVTVPAHKLERALFTELIKAVKTEPSKAAAIDAVVKKFEKPGFPNALDAFKARATELLSI